MTILRDNLLKINFLLALKGAKQKVKVMNCYFAPNCKKSIERETVCNPDCIIPNILIINSSNSYDTTKVVIPFNCRNINLL